VCGTRLRRGCEQRRGRRREQGAGVGAETGVGAGVGAGTGADVGADVAQTCLWVQMWGRRGCGGRCGADMAQMWGRCQADAAVGADVAADAGAAVGAAPGPGRQPTLGSTVPRAPTRHRLLPGHLPSSRPQLFLATDTCRTQLAYSRAVAALLANADAFTTAATMAQALPALHGRSYLDVAATRCQEEPGRRRGSRAGVRAVPPRRRLGLGQYHGDFLPADTLTPVSPVPPAETPGNKTVRLVVECPEPRCPRHQLYDRLVPAPAGASLLDVLKAAAAQDPHDFTYVVPRARVGGRSGDPGVAPGAAACPAPRARPAPHCPGRQSWPSAGAGPSPRLPPPGLRPRTRHRAPS